MWSSQFLFVTPLSPSLVGAGLALMFLIALLSTLIPALRAARIPPAIASRAA